MDSVGSHRNYGTNRNGRQYHDSRMFRFFLCGSNYIGFDFWNEIVASINSFTTENTVMERYTRILFLIVTESAGSSGSIEYEMCFDKFNRSLFLSISLDHSTEQSI